MTLTTAPTPVTDPADDGFVDLAAEIGAQVAGHAEQHDREGTFVGEAYDLLRDSGYLRLAVPAELGGLGASMRQVCFAQAELARGCGSTALAVNMHIYVTLLQAYRRRTGAPDAEGVLRRVADEGIVLMTSGGSDWLWSNSAAVAEEGGFRVSGRKSFCSQAPAADVLTTSAIHDDPERGREVLMFGVPMSGDGVTIDETWDALGMRGTGSHDVVLDDVFVPAEKIVARRAWGRFDGPLKAAVVHFAPTIAAVYWGIASGARDQAVQMITKMRRGETPYAEVPRVHRQLGQMDTTLRTSWWALLGALDDLGDDYVADAEAVNTVSIAKRAAVLGAFEVVDEALDLVGGPSYYRSTPLERAWRDVRAGRYHPLTPETTLFYVGRTALGGADDEE